MKTPAKLRSLFELAVVITVCLLLATYFLELWNAEWRIPFYYSGGDSFQSHAVFKSIIDVGTYLQNPMLGAPGRLEYYDFPRTDHVHLLIARFLSIFSSDFALLVNLFFILTFPLTAAIAFVVLRHFGISFTVALVCSLLYSLFPYHFVRGQAHLFLNFYCFVPLGVAMAIWVSRDDAFLIRNTKGRLWPTKRGVAAFIFCLLIASSGTYYTFFSCFLLFVAGLYAYLRTQNRIVMAKAGFLIFLLVGSAFLNLIPVFLYWRSEGKNPGVAKRSFVEAEAHALKLTGLLLPGNGHRFLPLNRMMRQYPATMMKENHAAYLGIVGVIGFLVLLAWLFFQRMKSSEDELKRNLSVFNGSLLLLGLAGGLGPLFAFVLFSQFRGYNRVSIFLGFIALFAFGIILDQFRNRHSTSSTGRILMTLLPLGILAAALWDQTIPAYAVRKPKQIVDFKNDAAFVKQIESLLPAGSMIFQLPFHPFPEADGDHRMKDYDHFRGYLHSSKLRWSYGAMKGRKWDVWQRQAVELPYPQFLQTLRAAGFRGVYFDRFGYSRKSSDETQLQAQLGDPVFESEDRRLLFFLL